GTLFHASVLAKPVADESEYRAALARRFGDANIDAIVARYPVASFASANAALAEVSGDAFFVCPARRNVRTISKVSPVYRYSFEHPPEQPLVADLGAFHSGEIPFVFGLDVLPLGKVGSATGLRDSMQLAWTSFAAAGEPGSNWPRWDGGETLHVLDLVE